MSTQQIVSVDKVVSDVKIDTIKESKESGATGGCSQNGGLKRQGR